MARKTSRPRGRPVQGIVVVHRDGRRTKHATLAAALAACGRRERVERQVYATTGNTYRAYERIDPKLPAKKPRVLLCEGRGGAYRRGLRVRHRWLIGRCLFCGLTKEEVGAR